MAKSKKTTTKAVLNKKTASAQKSKEPVKKIAAKPESKKITAAPEKKKIAAKPEPEKITAKPEPKKIKTVEAVKIETKAVKSEPKKTMKATEKTKPMVKKTVKEEKTVKAVKPVKEDKTVKPAKTVSAAKDVKEVKAVKPIKEEKKAEITSAPVKKETKAVAKKAITKPAVKKETKVVEKVEKSKPATKPTAKKVEKPAKKVAPKTTKAIAKPAKKTVEKPVEKKATKKSKKATYDELNLDECINLLQKMGIMHSYEDYKAILLDESDLKVIEKNMINGNNLKDAKFDFDVDGYDFDLISFTLNKVADTMEIKAADMKTIKKEINASTKTKYGEDEETNAKEYLKEFKLAEKILMFGQRKNIHDSKEVSELIGSDVDAFMDHFFTLAYTILPTWQYDDVKFYEDFAYAILSQYNDLYAKDQLRILIDCADLYIKHGDFQHGDENYGYILRDNQIKDYIYYRFVSVYENIDLNKAKGLAYESLQYVDDRYTYYPNIIEIMNK